MEKSGSSYIGYSLEVAFSIILMALTLNLSLLCKYRYGNSMITHLSLKPYLVALALLCVMLCEIVCILYFSNIFYPKDPLKLIQMVLRVDSPLNIILNILANAKYTLVLYFILTRAHEQMALVAFVTF